MIFVDTTKNNQSTCAYFFGLEEHLIKDVHQDEDIFLLWTVRPTVMIGRHQVTEREVDADYLAANDIAVVRRNSGGGAVYTDPGCFQFSFITDAVHHGDIFQTHVQGIIDAINDLGLPATFAGRNDILLDGRKFSGNAEYIYKNKMVVHGTILFDTNLDHLIGSLTPDKSKLTKHAIQSVASRVVNIGTKLDLDQTAFRDHLIASIADRTIDVNQLDAIAIERYAEKFRTEDWNYGKNPKYGITREMKFDSGMYRVDLDIKGNLVYKMAISGDFFALQDIAQFEQAFLLKPFTRNAFVEVTKQTKVNAYFHGLRRSEFLRLVFGEHTRRRPVKPDHLKVDLANLNKQTKEIRALLKQHNLHTVCQEASCPNQMECFSSKTATFMILGTHCTRNCSFCDVPQDRPQPVDPEEPKNILRAVKLMNLKHVVITSVCRDDLKNDYGSKHFAECIRTIQKGAPETTIEVLIPDFLGHVESIQRVVDAKPDVINHNLETVRRISPDLRDRATYDRSLFVLRTVKKMDPSILTKSGLMVGVGETPEEVVETMEDLRAVGCDILTIGQYLQPSKEHREVHEYVSLDTFEQYRETGKQLGFRFIASGPMVRSSYMAHKQFEGD